MDLQETQEMFVVHALFVGIINTSYFLIFCKMTVFINIVLIVLWRISFYTLFQLKNQFSRCDI